jgi:hypothetical protein
LLEQREPDPVPRSRPADRIQLRRWLAWLLPACTLSCGPYEVTAVGAHGETFHGVGAQNLNPVRWRAVQASAERDIPCHAEQVSLKMTHSANVMLAEGCGHRLVYVQKCYPTQGEVWCSYTLVGRAQLEGAKDGAAERRMTHSSP